ncbi:hypothetical protein CAJAP_05652 [Camponotus japonicus]
MASNEDGDLIDLGNDACVPRVAVDDATAEEQEHLLDVCPPKLEQKLFLTKQQEQVLDSTDKGDILVTLGHDQVVPIRKRIDVVSSDTIKRIRDITKNLEPVIRRTCINEEIQQDTVDYATLDEKTKRSTAKHEDETYEAQEINNAFDFLSEHDDNEDRAEASSGRPKNENVNVNRSLSSMRLLTEKEDTVNYPFESSSRTSSEETTEGSDTEERIDVVMPNEYDVQLDNPAFESSPDSKKCRENDAVEDRSVFVDLEPHTRTVLKRRGQEDVAFERGSKKRFFREPHRKSWTEGTRLNAAFTDELPGIDRSTSLEEYYCVPSTSDVDRGLSSFLTSQPPEAESATGVEDGCSEGSEVDWSWLEEVECLRAAEPLASGERDGEQEGDAPSPTDEGGGRRRACDRRETAATRSAAMSVTATAKSPAIGGSRWPSPGGALFLDRQNNNNVGQHRNVNNNDEDDDDDDDNEAERCNATNEAVDRENRYGTTTTTSATATSSSAAGSIAATANSWMRASMRRLRHLRLPEGATREPANRRAASVSAPNSLPDIALIAPEILAAQTNGGTSGALLRPSSAPARNAATATPAPASVGVATPRRAGRQFTGGGRSRDARNREAASSRQGSLGSTTTASDITASGNTTCSSGASTSPASSTATTPQRATSRRSVHDFIVERMIVGNMERCDRFMIDR